MISLTVPDIRDEDIHRAVEVFRSGMLVQGKQVYQLEHQLAEYIGVRNVVTVSSGTAALHLSLLALGIGAGDAVLVPAFSFVATANAVRLTGAVPVFVDVLLDNYNIDVELLEQVIGAYACAEKLKAIIPVHEFGCPADLVAICRFAQRHSLHVIEDAACALGASVNGRHVGTFGDCGCFSFHPRKSITTGEGGVIVTDDDVLADRLRLIRSHGVVRNKLGYIDCVKVGYNYRMTDFQAALAIGQLSRFEDNLHKRKKIVDTYYMKLGPSHGYVFPEMTEGHAWQSLMLMLDQGEFISLVEDAHEAGIQLGQGAQCIPRTTVYGLSEGFPVANRCEQQGFVVPLYAGLSISDVERVIEFLEEVI